MNAGAILSVKGTNISTSPQAKQTGKSDFLKTLQQMSNVEAKSETPQATKKFLIQLLGEIKQIVNESGTHKDSINTDTATDNTVNLPLQALFQQVVAALSQGGAGIEVVNTGLIEEAKQKTLLAHIQSQLEGKLLPKLLSEDQKLVKHFAQALDQLIRRLETVNQTQVPSTSVTTRQHNVKHSQVSAMNAQELLETFIKTTERLLKKTEKGYQNNKQPLLKSGNVVVQQTHVKSLPETAGSAFRRFMIQPEKGGEPTSMRQAQINVFESGPMSRMQQFAIHMERNGSNPTQQQFVREFQQILAKSNFSLTQGRQQLTIKLYPEHLGTLDVQIVRENGQMTARLLTTTSAAKELIQSQLHQLRNAFLSQNLLVDKLEVNQSFQQSSLQQHQHEEPSKEHHQHREEEREQPSPDDNDESETSFGEWLEKLNLIDTGKVM